MAVHKENLRSDFKGVNSHKKEQQVMSEIPKKFQRFMGDFPAVAEAYNDLGAAVHGNGPLDEKTRALIKIGISTGARMEGAVHSHVRKALAVGLTPEEIRHAVVLSLPTIGLPGMMAALTWANDILDEQKGK
jgi:alkylhydroperoxidase/carboxymuconolactone decarboxylase family protein YurZ